MKRAAPWTRLPVCLAGALFGAAGVAVCAEAPSAVLPPGEGQVLAQRVCGQCHSVELVMRHRMTRRQWLAQIDTMIARGAKIADEEIDPLADYLATVLGPTGAE